MKASSPKVLKNNFFIVDVESTGPHLLKDKMTEFSIIHVRSGEALKVSLYETVPAKDTPAIPVIVGSVEKSHKELVEDVKTFIERFSDEGHPVFWSDNPAFDWQWTNLFFLEHLGENPFGFSARRIGDFYAGLEGNLKKANNWKKYRVTPHTHDSLDDVKGNREALLKIFELYSVETGW